MLQMVSLPTFSGSFDLTRLKVDSAKVAEKSHNQFLKKWVDPAFLSGTTLVPVKKSALEDWMKIDPKFIEKGDLNLNTDNTSLLVFGDGLAAGWKDAGLTRDGQQFAFPNLVARQMNFKDFNSPLFDISHGNGTGYLVKDQGSALPRWKEVSNNVAISSSDEIPELFPYEGEEAENLALPRISRGSISGTLSPIENGWIFDESRRRYTDDMPFLWRLYPGVDKNKVTYWQMVDDQLKSKKPSIVLSAFGFDEMTEQNIKNMHVKISWALASSEVSPLSILIADRARAAGAKGVVFTIPDFRHLPYFKWYSKSQLDQINSQTTITRSRENVLHSDVLKGNMIFLPTKDTDMLFSVASEGRSLEFPLSDKDVADSEEIDGGSSQAINERIKKEAKEKGLLIVDLAALYEKLHEGEIKTDDGYIIDGGIKGNFFSGDGLYPSYLGNAVIANETIKVLNTTFNSRIPLINVTEFAALIKE